jgi:anti-sigma factor (TIGR02949 family)
MLTCKDVIQALTEYLEGDLNPVERERFERHMADCTPCMAFLRTYEKSSELATAALRAEEIPNELQERVRGFLREKLGLDA